MLPTTPSHHVYAVCASFSCSTAPPPSPMPTTTHTTTLRVPSENDGPLLSLRITHVIDVLSPSDEPVALHKLLAQPHRIEHRGQVTIRLSGSSGGTRVDSDVVRSSGCARILVDSVKQVRRSASPHDFFCTEARRRVHQNQTKLGLEDISDLYDDDGTVECTPFSHSVVRWTTLTPLLSRGVAVGTGIRDVVVTLDCPPMLQDRHCMGQEGGHANTGAFCGRRRSPSISPTMDSCCPQVYALPYVKVILIDTHQESLLLKMCCQEIPFGFRGVEKSRQCRVLGAVAEPVVLV